MVRTQHSLPTLITLLPLVAAACGGEELGAPSDDHASAAVASANPTPAATSPSTSTLWDDDPPFEVRVNHDAAAVTQDVLPALSDDFGLDAITLPTHTIASGTAGAVISALSVCHTTSAPWRLKLKNVEVNAALDADALVTRFDSNRKLLGDLDLPSFSAQGTIEFSWQRDLSGWYCDTFGSDYVFAVNINIDGVDGTLDVTLADSGSIALTSIDAFELDVDRVSFDSSLLTWITNLGLTVSEMFGGSCGSLTACVNDAIDDDFTSRGDIKDALIDAVSAALADTGTLEGALDFGVGTLDYAVRLADVSTNDTKDRLRTKWDVDFSTSTPDSTCAAALTRSRFAQVNDVQTTNDLELVVPFKKVTDALYVLTKQGDLCAPFRYATAAGSTIVQVKPRGAYQLTPTGSNGVSLTLPIAVEAQVSANATSAITGTLTVTARLQPGCGGAFQLVPVSVTLGNLTGTMTYVLPTGATINMSASTFISTQKGPAESAILRALSPGLSLVPSAFGLGGVSRWISIGSVQYDSTAMTLGLNLASRDPYCP